MLNLKNWFKGRRPDVVPSRTDATKRLDDIRQTQAEAADKRKLAEDALARAALNSADEITLAGLRKEYADAQAREHEIGLMVDAAEAVHAAAVEAERTLDRESFEAEGRAALEELLATARDADAKIAELAQISADKWIAAVQKARAYLSDEGLSAVINAQMYLAPCVSYRLRDFPGFQHNLMLTTDTMESWARHMPPLAEWRRLIAGADKKGG